MSRIRIERISITDTGTDCIVNAANEQLRGGSGVCEAIFKAAGWNRLQSACDAIGHCDTGSAVITPAFDLNAKYIIHAVGPIWYDGTRKEPQKLYSCYRASLDLARENGCHSIAFPLISAGIFGYPKSKAWRKALQACNDFIRDNPEYDIDIVFAVLDRQIQLMGEEELKNLSENDNTQNATPSSADDELLEQLDGRKLRSAISAAIAAENADRHDGEQPDSMLRMRDCFSIFKADKDDQEHYEKYCKGVLPSEMNVRQIRTTLTYLSSGDHSDADYPENKVLLKLLLRLDDLLIRYYESHGLPTEMRFHNPVFWYEMDSKRNPVLVKGNGEKLTIDYKSPSFSKTRQSQQGWQRARLFMDMTNEWDATGFGATMSATFAFGPDEEGRCYTFTSCEQAEKNLYPNLLSPEQVTKCRNNVDNFYADPKLQMEWKEMILHPVCVVLRADGSLEPKAVRDVDAEILEKYWQNVVDLGDESYKWIFKD